MLRAGPYAINSLLAIAIILMLSGCYRLHRYRRDDELLTATTQTAPYRIGFVEFDDQGVMYSQGQLAQVMQHIESGPEKLVVVFAHGWFHNAAHGDSNLKFFGEVLAQASALEIAQASQEGRTPREVFGVFLGWRGAAWRTPLLKYLTFWSRKDAAHRVGERQAMEALLGIRKAAYKSQTRCEKAPTRLIVIGHSFGGALVYSAVSQLAAHSLLDGSTDKLADAVLLFNPAFEAARWEHLTALAISSSKPRPKIAIFTSKTDRATGWAFPVGRSLNTLLQTSRTIDNDVFHGKIRERKSNNRAVGHFVPYITHDLRSAGVDQACPDAHGRKHIDPDALTSSPTARVADKANAMLDEIRAEYDAGKAMRFGATCLIPRTGLLHPQMNVMNVAMDRDIWNGHAFEQTDGRRKKVLSFVALFFPFVGGVEQPQECLAPPTTKIETTGPTEAEPGPLPASKSKPEYRF